MRLLVKALAGRVTSPAASARLFGLFLVTTFAVEAAVMGILPRIMARDMGPVPTAFIDATILTVILAPVVWQLFVVPVRRLHDARALLLERVLSVQEDERRRIARDLHDGIGQSLTSILLRLRVLAQALPDPALAAQVQAVRSITGETLEDLRHLVRDTRPPVLDDLGLAAAVEKLVVDAGTTDDVATRFTWAGGDPTRLSGPITTALYRIVQEAVTNSLKHAAGSRIDVTIDLSDDAVVGRIVDNGIGFDAAAAVSDSVRSFGLSSMKERALQLGGTVSIDSQPGRGTTVLVRIPVARSPA